MQVYVSRMTKWLLISPVKQPGGHAGIDLHAKRGCRGIRISLTASFSYVCGFLFYGNS